MKAPWGLSLPAIPYLQVVSLHDEDAEEVTEEGEESSAPLGLVLALFKDEDGEAKAQVRGGGDVG